MKNWPSTMRVVGLGEVSRAEQELQATQEALERGECSLLEATEMLSLVESTQQDAMLASTLETCCGHVAGRVQNIVTWAAQLQGEIERRAGLAWDPNPAM